MFRLDYRSVDIRAKHCAEQVVHFEDVVFASLMYFVSICPERKEEFFLQDRWFAFTQ